MCCITEIRKYSFIFLSETIQVSYFDEKRFCLMTVINNVKTTVAGLKSAQASLEGFALDTDNQQAKQLFQTAAQQTQSIIDSLNPRVEEVQQEEPQYGQQ